MASTNKTPHYELSQFLGTDVPSWLNDYNADNRAIDTGIYNAQNKADSAYTLADTADGKADNATTTANSALTNAGTANTNIGTMANLSTTEKATLVGAINEVDAEAYDLRLDINKFNLSVNSSLSVKSKTNVNNVGALDVRLATNSDTSIFKLYGYIACDHLNSGQAYIYFDSTLRPSEAYTIANSLVNLSNGQLVPTSVRVGTDGEIRIGWNATANTVSNIVLPACIYFNKSFGDVSAP